MEFAIWLDKQDIPEDFDEEDGYIAAGLNYIKYLVFVAKCCYKYSTLNTTDEDLLEYIQERIDDADADDADTDDQDVDDQDVDDQDADDQDQDYYYTQLSSDDIKQLGFKVCPFNCNLDNDFRTRKKFKLLEMKKYLMQMQS
jgi:hypothetical protein